MLVDFATSTSIGTVASSSGTPASFLDMRSARVAHSRQRDYQPGAVARLDVYHSATSEAVTIGPALATPPNIP